MERVSPYIISKNEYDVIVVGGGTTGCAAAIAAARNGANTLIIEKLPFVGGNMTGGLPWLGFHAKETGEPVVGGIPMEIINRLQKIGAATEFVMDPITGSAVGVNGSMLKLLLMTMLKESGVSILLHSMVVDVEKKGASITGVFVQSKMGVELIRSRLIIDCTDNADVCLLAGCEAIMGRGSDNKCQIASNVIVYGDINYPEMLEYFRKNPDQVRPFALDDVTLKKLLKQMETAPIFVVGAFQKIIEQAKKDGVPYCRKQLIGVAYPCYNELMLVASRVEDVDLNNKESHTNGEIEGLEQTWGILQLLHNYIPGCQDARIVSIGTQLGIRETRHVVGEYMLSANDLLSGFKFEDSISRGNYHLDIHSPDHNGLETRQPPIYYIPYRSLLPKGIDNLMVAGRCISATHEAMSSTRVAPISAAQGQAAGTAAALCIKSEAPLRELEINELHEALSKNSALY